MCTCHYSYLVVMFMNLYRTLSLFMLLVFISACEQQKEAPVLVTAEALPGGGTTIRGNHLPSLLRPVENLPQDQRPDFYAGNALANQPWVKAPTVTDARDGLGPIYNARTCMACHINGGRGSMPLDSNSPLFSAFVRISLPSKTKEHGDEITENQGVNNRNALNKQKVYGVIPDPMYGDQLQGQSVALFHQLRGSMPLDDPSRKTEVPPEAYVYVDWQLSTFTYPDGEEVTLRKPQLRVTNLGYGKLNANTLMSLRNAPAIHGVGLLELVDQQDIDRLSDPDDQDNNGISGRVNAVWDFESLQTVPGRFGWKANRANLRIVTAAAFSGDVGISSPLFGQPCTNAQALCKETPNGNGKDGLELSADLLDLVTNFSRNIGVAKRRNSSSPEVRLGREYFYQSECAGCHQPSYVTTQSTKLPHLGGQIIWPYTDLLLHDMGSELADNRPDYQASGSEWRTPPLWGTGLSEQINGSSSFLHDGRAKSIEEAILWHGGEGERSKSIFAELSSQKRQALIQFVKSL